MERRLLRLFFCAVTVNLISLFSFSQAPLDSVLNKIDPQKLSAVAQKRLGKFEDKIVAKSAKTLHRLQKQEERIYRKQLAAKDSLLAKAKVEEIHKKYQALEEKLKNPASITPTSLRQYIPHLDTLKTALKFLNQQRVDENIQNTLSKVESYENKVQQAEEIKAFVRERREQLFQELKGLGLVKDLKRYDKEVYYYSEHLKEYKTLLSDPNKIEKKALELLSKTRVFQDFMRKNSMLASLFRIPGDPNDPSYVASLAGLQTRVQVNNLIQQQLAASGSNANAQFQQNLQQAQSQMQQLRSKVTQAGGGSSDDIMPQSFKPNSQRTKSFLKRLEYGTNFQSQRAQNYFPATTDLGLSVGLKLNDKSIVGIGASYKVGLGRGWNHIEVSNEGAGLRSYLDWKLKKSFWMSGGFEMNYLTSFNSIAQLHSFSAWQQSGLIGLSKIFDTRSKLFKKTKLQLLWDFLSYQQQPRSQPIKFRVGYNF